MSGDDRPIVVIKIGGSLLDWPELPARLEQEIALRRDSRLALVVGGGALADAIRDLDRIHRIGETRSHHLALRALDVSAHVVEGLVPGLKVAETRDELAVVWQSGQSAVLSPRRFLEEIDALSAHPLPRTWSSTTDSIAAKVAGWLGAEDLVLWKSASLPLGATPGDAVGLGLVDPEFPRAIRGLPRVSYRNVRAAERNVSWIG